MTEAICDFADVYQAYEPGFEDKLCQGDIFNPNFFDFEILNSESISGWMIVNATCDLVTKNKTDYLKFIPIRPLDFLIKQNKEQGKEKIQKLLDIIIKYNSMKTFFLPPSIDFRDEKPHYAELGYILSFAITYDFDKLTKELLKFRIVSIKYPWREKLAESLSNSFLRIGVPDPPKNWKDWRDSSIEKFLPPTT